VYSENRNNNKPESKKLSSVDRIDAINSVKDMVRTGEGNVGFLCEIVQCNWKVSFKQAQKIALEGIMLASNN
jgi:hypothetical protein